MMRVLSCAVDLTEAFADQALPAMEPAIDDEKWQLIVEQVDVAMASLEAKPCVAHAFDGEPLWAEPTAIIPACQCREAVHKLEASKADYLPHSLSAARLPDGTLCNSGVSIDGDLSANFEGHHYTVARQGHNPLQAGCYAALATMPTYVAKRGMK